jgi:hypothetical protein
VQENSSNLSAYLNYMSYSLNLITLPSEADTLIRMAQRDKRNLQHRLESFDIRNENSAEDAAELAAELAAARASLDASIAMLATLPDGERKEDEETKKMELELRIRKLTKSGNKKGAVAILEREYDAELIERELAGIDDFIAAVTARKEAL